MKFKLLCMIYDAFHNPTSACFARLNLLSPPPQHLHASSKSNYKEFHENTQCSHSLRPHQSFPNASFSLPSPLASLPTESWRMSPFLWILPGFHLIISPFTRFTAPCSYHILLSPLLASLVFLPNFELLQGGYVLFIFVTQHWGHNLTSMYFTKYLLSASCTDKASWDNFHPAMLSKKRRKKKKRVTPRLTQICFHYSLKLSSAVYVDMACFRKRWPTNWFYWTLFSWLSISQIWKAPKEAALLCCHLFQVSSLFVCNIYYGRTL